VDLGGLSFLELAKRTARASWRDAVFGQGSRMAFYHFLAIFPALLLLLTLAGRLQGTGIELKDTVLDLSRQVLPRDASLLFKDMLNELNRAGPISGTNRSRFLRRSLGRIQWNVGAYLRTEYGV
jgi:uncharacterized BrkB/YihY/UPF0761 family membrane protein